MCISTNILDIITILKNDLLKCIWAESFQIISKLGINNLKQKKINVVENEMLLKVLNLLLNFHPKTTFYFIAAAG